MRIPFSVKTCWMASWLALLLSQIGRRERQFFHLLFYRRDVSSRLSRLVCNWPLKFWFFFLLLLVPMVSNNKSLGPGRRREKKQHAGQNDDEGKVLLHLQPSTEQQQQQHKKLKGIWCDRRDWWAAAKSRKRQFFFLLIFSRVPNQKKKIRFGGLRVGAGGGARAPLSFFLGENKK